MSKKAARASAREIRRAFGPAAVAHLDAMEAHLDDLAQKQAQTHNVLEYFVKRVDRADQQIARDAEGWMKLCGRTMDRLPLKHTFLGRLRWLFTGK